MRGQQTAVSCARVKHDEIGLAVLWEGIIGDRGVLITFGGEKRSPSPANSLAAPSGGHRFSRMQRSSMPLVERTKETDSHTGFPVRRSVLTRRRRIH